MKCCYSGWGPRDQFTTCYLSVFYCRHAVPSVMSDRLVCLAFCSHLREAHLWNNNCFKIAKENNFIYFFKHFWWTHISFYETADSPDLDFWWHLFWVSKPEWPTLFTEAEVMYIPWDLPLVWHLLTSWWPAWQPVAIPDICVSAEVRCWIWMGDLMHSSLMR